MGGITGFDVNGQQNLFTLSQGRMWNVYRMGNSKYWSHHFEYILFEQVFLNGVVNRRCDYANEEIRGMNSTQPVLDWTG